MAALSATHDEAQHRLTLAADGFALTLATGGEFRAQAWVNRLAGATLQLDGPELAVDLDTARRRVWLQGWRCHGGDVGAAATDDEAGCRAGHARPEFDDHAWACFEQPLNAGARLAGRVLWARTQVVLPREVQGQPVALLLGGCGLFDFRQMRVFVNGTLIGTRTTRAFWTPPGVFTLAPGDAAYGAWQWGAANVIALQLADQVTRTARLDALDPLGSRHFPGPDILASPFDQCVAFGVPERRVAFRFSSVRPAADGAGVVVELAAADAPLRAELTYRTDAAGAILHRDVALTNTGAAPLRVLSVHHGEYDTGATVSPGQRGFPVYADGHTFFALAHPSGWVTGERGAVRLRQDPGHRLAPGATFAAMEALRGAAPAGQARVAFVAHVRSRTRRVQRGHDRPYAIFDNFGSWPIGPGQGSWVENTEADCRHSICCLADDQRAGGARFDLFSIDFWVDPAGDLRDFAARRFPHGLATIRAELAALGTAPGLWIDSSMSGWSIGDQPAVQGCFTHNFEYAPQAWCGHFFCRATEPINTLYIQAFCHHLRTNGVRHLKFDNLRSYCYNTRHTHLPGRYSTQAIHDAVIAALRAYDAACPDVFLFLYWGYRSPWWLLHGDVLFEPGLNLEAASPSGAPTLYARDGVSVGLDQAQWWCEDLPPLGKDSLGVWLSDWFWNSSVGAERWPEGFVLDLCRGSLLAQPWADRDWLTPPERRQMADLIALLRAAPACFARPRFVLGNPWRDEPYGYCCTDGERAFIALNNCTWHDVTVPLELGAAWGLPEGGAWDVCRWHPAPARLQLARDTAGRPTLALRPFAVVLLEVFPAGARPSLDRDLPTVVAPQAFADASRDVDCAVSAAPVGEAPALPAGSKLGQALRLAGSAPASPSGGVLAVTVELLKDGKRFTQGDPGRQYAAVATLGGQTIAATPALRDKGYPAGWQAWRLAVLPSPAPQPWALSVSFTADASVSVTARAHWLPGA